MDFPIVTQNHNHGELSYCHHTTPALIVYFYFSDFRLLNGTPPESAGKTPIEPVTVPHLGQYETLADSGVFLCDTAASRPTSHNVSSVLLRLFGLVARSDRTQRYPPTPSFPEITIVRRSWE